MRCDKCSLEFDSKNFPHPSISVCETCFPNYQKESKESSTQKSITSRGKMFDLGEFFSCGIYHMISPGLFFGVAAVVVSFFLNGSGKTIDIWYILLPFGMAMGFAGSCGLYLEDLKDNRLLVYVIGCLAVPIITYMTFSIYLGYLPVPGVNVQMKIFLIFGGISFFFSVGQLLRNKE